MAKKRLSLLRCEEKKMASARRRTNGRQRQAPAARRDLPGPPAAMLPVIAETAPEAWAETELAAVQGVEVFPYHGEQSGEMGIGAGSVAVRFDLGHLRLDNRPDFQARFLLLHVLPQ
jgi:hypothetical protein